MPLQDLFDAITLLLTPLGLLALALSSFLVINTISALMSQQVRQIGVMKSVGARRGQIVAMYLSSVLIYSLLALAVAIPLTALVSSALAQFLGGFINVTFPALAMPLNVLLIEVVVGIGVPLLAALYPIYRGTSVTCAKPSPTMAWAKASLAQTASPGCWAESVASRGPCNCRCATPSAGAHG